MKNKLPKVFANNITKEINNNEKIYTSIEQKQKQEQKIPKQQPKTQQKNIIQKINKILNTKEYTYKIPVKIITKEKEIITKIIGKTEKNIITIENKLIKIEDIINIEKYNEET